ncbi:MAG TPA: copper uptake system-associated protein [Xanthobacteraceae bacterium]|nr:copper uptake system-associated protein [Xanthobacteraceae bacterium]
MRYLMKLASSSAKFASLIAAIVLAASASAMAQTGDQAAITRLLHGTFDRQGMQLTIDPIVVSGNYAVAGWTQVEIGGRALLRKKQQSWMLILCAGDEIKSANALTKAGVPDQDASALAGDLATAEAKLPQQHVAMFSRFAGIMMMDGSGAGVQHDGHPHDTTH